MEMNEIASMNIDSIMAALGLEVTALGVYKMDPKNENNKDRVLKSMADVMAQNMVSLRSLDLTADELSTAFKARLDELLAMAKQDVAGDKD